MNKSIILNGSELSILVKNKIKPSKHINNSKDIHDISGDFENQLNIREKKIINEKTEENLNAEKIAMLNSKKEKSGNDKNDNSSSSNSNDDNDTDGIDVEYQVQFILPDITSYYSLNYLNQEPSLPFSEHAPKNVPDNVLDSVTENFPENVMISLLYDGISILPNSYKYNLIIHDVLKNIAIFNPVKGGFLANNQVIISIENIPTVVKECIVRIHGELKHLTSGIPSSINSILHTDVQGVIYEENSLKFIKFLLPESDVLSIVSPILIKKSKYFNLLISIDNGLTFDSSSTPILNIK